MAPVFTLFYRDSEGTTTVLGVYADLQDANATCLSHATDAGVDPLTPAASASPATTSDDAKDTAAAVPRPTSPRRTPLRWSSPDGTSCWVERHDVIPRKALQPGAGARGDLKRNESHPRLYDNDDDDVIEHHDDDAKYD